MGNDPNKYISLHIKDEDKEQVLDEQKSDIFYKLYQQFSQATGFLSKEDFNRLVKIGDEKILEEIFDIFASKKGKMYYSDLLTFYTSFTNNNLKSIVLSFLLFGKNGKISKNNYINKLTQFININEDFLILTNPNFLKLITYVDKGYNGYIPSFKFTYFTNTSEKDSVYYEKNLFIKYSDALIKQKKLNFSFFKNIIPSSQLNNTKIKNIKDTIYICDCLLEKVNLNINSSDELEEMRYHFNMDKSINNGHLPFVYFENIMKELRVNQKLIDIIIKFLKNYTMKDYLNFEDFKNLMSNLYFRVSITHKKQFLFKMILAITNEKTSIKMSQLCKILKIDNKDYKPQGTLDEKGFESMKDPIINAEIDNYIGYMDSFGLLPYVKYKVKPVGQDLKKKIINFILNNRTAEEYLIQNFDKCEYFYVINMTYWKSLIEPGTLPEIEVNNSIIAEEDSIFYINKKEENQKKEEKKEQEKQNQVKPDQTNQNKEEKNKEKEKGKEVEKKQEIKIKGKKIGKLQKEKKYGVDYVIICGDLYQKIEEYFEIDYEIKLTKIIKYLTQKKEGKVDKKEGNSNQETPEPEIEEKLEINTSKNYLYKKGNEKEGIKEYVVDFYPVKILQISLKSLINHIESEKSKIDEKKKIEEWEKKSDEEKNKIIKEKDAIEKNKKIRESQYTQKLEQLNKLISEEAIEKTLYDEKIKILNEQYKDVFVNENTKQKKKDVNIKKSEFFELLKININDIIYYQKNKLQKQSRYSTVKEIRDILIKFNDNLNTDNFNVYYYTLENEFSNPKDESTFLNNGIDEFTLVIADIKNKEGKYYLSIMEENEKIVEETKEDNKDKINLNELTNTEILSKEELKKIKENQNEKEKQRKQQEKLEREKYEKMEKEKLEKIKKEKENKEKKEKMVKPPYGIPNFGNTCYFNSINQIFFNLPIMQELFMNKKIKYFINRNNKFGYKGKFITAFMSLYYLYPSKIDDYAENLKALVGKFKYTFNNREQQDANEYLNFVLDALHEELNLKTVRRYIVDKDYNYKYNNEEELGNIAWANHLRRNVSFIDSIFMFQLKSNLTCKRCGTKKFNFETNYIFDLPLSLCKMVTVSINLYRLPFKYKIYYDKINKNFSDFIKLEENKNNNIMDNLRNYYTDKLNYEQKLEHCVHTNFEFDFERQKSLEDMIKLLRNINLLNLEPEDFEVNINNQEITEYKIKHFTDFIISSDNNKYIKNDTIIDKFVDVNDRVCLNIYEVLNTNGQRIIYQNQNQKEKNKTLISEFNLFSYKIKKKGVSKIEDYEKKIQNTNYYNNFKEGNTNLVKEEGDSKSTISSSTNEDSSSEQNQVKLNILSLNDKLSYYSEDIIANSIDSKKTKKIKILTEFFIPIIHFRRDLSPGRSSIFLDFYHSHIKYFPQQFLVFNNSNYYKITPKQLYNYIWDYNSLYMNHPNKKMDKFWWNLDPNSNTESKKCYPFVIRIVRKKSMFNLSYDCVKCQWYNFCFGCVLYPDDEKYLIIQSDYIFFVDWCNNLIKEEIESYNFHLKRFSNEEITQCIESSAKNDKSKQYQSIQDCFEFFFEKELLEDPLSCIVCGGPENFFKKYEINKLPYILILSLKRFKYNENNNSFKLRQLITYPLNDFEINNKKYDLFGVVYHYGGINSGHYTCVVKHNNIWVMCDDRRVYEIPQERVMSSNAYILFYIAQESINNNSYYNCMNSLMQHIVIDKNKKQYYFEDNNYFKGEPVYTPYGEGYVINDYISDYKIEDNIKVENNKEKNDNEKNKEVTDEKEVNNNEKSEDSTNQNEIKEEDNKKSIIKNGLVEIKFDFGKGTLYTKNVKKQIIQD